MGRDYEEARRFSEEIDRMLSGEDVRAGNELDEDTRTALDFACWMTTVRPEPSPAFKARLNARMMQKINEQESEARRGWFWRLIPREAAWQAAVAMVLMLVIGGSLWGILFRPQGEVASLPPVTTAPVTLPPTVTTSPPGVPTTITASEGLMAYASNSKPVYVPGEKVRIDVVFKNQSSESLTLEDFPPAISLMNAKTGQPAYTFIGDQSDRTLAPGETAAISLDWDQRDNKGRSVPSGQYYVELETLTSQGQRLALNMVQPELFEIMPFVPDETGKVLMVDQSRSAGDVTITLKQIEISVRGLTIRAFVTPPPDYVLLPGTPALEATRNYQAAAGYSVDGEWVKEAGLSAVEYYGHGMEHMWYIPRSSLKEGRNLIFIVHNVGEWEGSWQFEVSLED